MTDIHVPDRVIEAFQDAIDDDDDYVTRDMVRVGLSAALAAWVECGMAREGNGFYFPDGKIGANEIEKLTTVPNTFPVLIIKTTEAP